MIKRLITLIFIFSSTQLTAQTGIGTPTPDASARLDVAASNKGFLPPRVTLTSVTDATTIPTPATGLLIYNTGNNVGLAAGYYYWNGNAWATIATSGGSGSFAASFLRGSRTATQSIAVDGIVSFSTVNNTGGQDIALNTGNGKITLAPGNTYRIIASVPNFSGGQRPAFMWYNETTSSYIGSASSTYNPGDNASLAASGGIAHVIITPSVSTVISFRLLSSLSSGSVTVGGNLDFSTTGSYPWFEAQVISGNAPVTGQSVDYVSVGSIYLTGVGDSRDLIFSTNFGGNIPYNTTTGVFTLSANKTYLFQAQVRANTPSANGSYIEYGFVDAISNALLVNGTQTITSSTTSTAGYGSNPVINFIYTPISNQTVKIRTTSTTTGTQTIVSGTANITQIGSSATVNPWTLSGTNTYNTTGNVGVGTNSPTSKLNIVGGGIKLAAGLGNSATRPSLNTSSIGNYEIRGVGGSPSQVDWQDDGFLRLSAGGGTDINTQSSIDMSGYSTVGDMNNNIVMRTGGTERLRINNIGNVGIGNSSPTEKLEVNGNVKASSFIGTASSATLYLLEANASVTYTLPGSYTSDPCRYSIVNNTVNVPSSWFNTSNYTFTPQKAGYWEFAASYDVYRNSESSLTIQKNGINVAVAGTISSVVQQIRKIVYLNGSTDYINVTNSGFNSNARSQNASNSWFQARWVGE